MIDNKVTKSSGNIFVDIGLENPEEMLVKAQIVHKIEQEIKNRNLTQDMQRLPIVKIYQNW